MDIAARVTSKGQITIPRAIRDALELESGDAVIFHLQDGHAVLSKTPNFLELAGSISVPAERRNVAWDEVLGQARADRASRHR